jgi:cytochrome c oxidase assembly protein subunit 15
VVTLHLLFGFATLSLLLWLVLSLPQFARWWHAAPIEAHGATARARLLAPLALIALTAQIALGGWTSSNYAALGCPDFPTCQAQWWPRGDYRSAFELHGAPGRTYEGGVLDAPARTAIQFTHRVAALVVAIMLLGAALSAVRLPGKIVRYAAGLVIAALAMQLVLGMSMVVRGFPLWLATAHSAGAALLLMTTVGLNRALRPPA